jgi:hypothetical protein
MKSASPLRHVRFCSGSTSQPTSIYTPEKVAKSIIFIVL